MSEPLASPTSSPVVPSAISIPIAHSTAAHRADPPPRNGHSTAAPLQIAVPTGDAAPDFASIYALAVTGAGLDQETIVVCLTDETIAGWRSRLQERSHALDGLTVVDGRFGWSVNWRAFFSQKTYDITVMHGLHTALRQESLPVSYAKRLLDAVPRGLIVLA